MSYGKKEEEVSVRGGEGERVRGRGEGSGGGEEGTNVQVVDGSAGDYVKGLWTGGYGCWGSTVDSAVCGVDVWCAG